MTATMITDQPTTSLVVPDPGALDGVLAEFGVGDLPECPFCGGELGLPAPPECPHCESPLEAHSALKSFAGHLLRDAARNLAQGNLHDARVRLALAREIDHAAGLAGLYLEAQASDFGKDYRDALFHYDEFSRLLDPVSPLYQQVLVRIRDIEELQRLEEGAKGFYNLALLRAKQGYLEEALALAERANALAPYLAKPHLLLHKLHLKLRHFEQAQYFLERYHAFEPGDSQVMALAQALVQNKADTRLQKLVVQVYWGFAWCFGILLFLVILILLRSGTGAPS
ncbi:MAG: tetratricopeptide repeat protein [bacterium]